MTTITKTLNALSSPIYQWTYRQSKISIYNMLCFFGLFIVALSYWIRREGMLMPNQVHDEGQADDKYSNTNDMKYKYGRTSSSGSQSYSNSYHSYSNREYSTYSYKSYSRKYSDYYDPEEK